MIREISGDLLLSAAQVIAHGVAPNDPFHSGLALQLRERWPAMYKDFRHYCQSRHPQPGTLWAWMSPDGIRIVSLFTQDGVQGHHGGTPGPATLQHAGHALRELQKLAVAEKFTSIALPRLSTGVGRLAWSDVKPLITQHLGALDIPVLVYATYHAGQKADEGL
jgi:O-acetyl-ADP-ribose deacetylase (regulator of RNase III)